MAGYRHHASIERGTVDGYSGQMDMMGAWLLVLSNTGAWAKLVQAIMFRQMARLKSVRPRCRTKRCLVAATAIAFALSSPPMSVLAQSHPMSIDDVPVRSMQYGASEFSSSQQNMTELLDGSFGELWVFDGQAGDRVEIIMRATSFDAYLILWFGTPFGEVIAVDDDSYAGTDALIAIQLPYTGPYVIAAAAANGPEHSGGYRISVKLLE